MFAARQNGRTHNLTEKIIESGAVAVGVPDGFTSGCNVFLWRYDIGPFVNTKGKIVILLCSLRFSSGCSVRLR